MFKKINEFISSNLNRFLNKIKLNTNIFFKNISIFKETKFVYKFISNLNSNSFIKNEINNNYIFFKNYVNNYFNNESFFNKKIIKYFKNFLNKNQILQKQNVLNLNTFAIIYFTFTITMFLVAVIFEFFFKSDALFVLLAKPYLYFDNLILINSHKILIFLYKWISYFDNLIFDILILENYNKLIVFLYNWLVYFDNLIETCFDKIVMFLYNKIVYIDNLIETYFDKTVMFLYNWIVCFENLITTFFNQLPIFLYNIFNTIDIFLDKYFNVVFAYKVTIEVEDFIIRHFFGYFEFLGELIKSIFIKLIEFITYLYKVLYFIHTVFWFLFKYFFFYKIFMVTNYVFLDFLPYNKYSTLYTYFFENISYVLLFNSNSKLNLVYFYILYFIKVFPSLLNSFFVFMYTPIILPTALFFSKIDTYFIFQNQPKFLGNYILYKHFFYKSLITNKFLFIVIFLGKILFKIIGVIKFIKFIIMLLFFKDVYNIIFFIELFNQTGFYFEPFRCMMLGKNNYFSTIFMFSDGPAFIDSRKFWKVVFFTHYFFKFKLLTFKLFLLEYFNLNKNLIPYFYLQVNTLFCFFYFLDNILTNIELWIFYFFTILDDFIDNIYFFSKFLILSISLQIINILLVLLFVLVGGILPLWERKYLSLVQRRIGPKFVGYKGRMQFIADALKVLFKDYLYLYHTNKFFFFILPVIFLNLNLLFFVNIIFYGNCSYLNIEYNILFLMFFSMYSNIILFLVGYVSKNKYTILSSNRILNLFFINEMFVSTIFLFIFLLFNSFSFNRIFFFKNYLPIIFLLLPILPLVFYLFLVDINKVPFDLVEAESELIMGYHVEYSGFLFGLFVLVEYLHLFFFIYILYILFSFF